VTQQGYIHALRHRLAALEEERDECERVSRDFADRALELEDEIGETATALGVLDRLEPAA
jgi:hypothetical protein